jgi:alcohol dehydrogenase
MLGMPKGLTAATGMDALTHAIEAYVSTASTPVTDACALHAMKLVASYLRTAVHHGDNIEARDMMRYAAKTSVCVQLKSISGHGTQLTAE